MGSDLENVIAATLLNTYFKALSTPPFRGITNIQATLFLKELKEVHGYEIKKINNSFNIAQDAKN